MGAVQMVPHAIQSWRLDKTATPEAVLLPACTSGPVTELRAHVCLLSGCQLLCGAVRAASGTATWCARCSLYLRPLCSCVSIVTSQQLNNNRCSIGGLNASTAVFICTAARHPTYLPFACPPTCPPAGWPLPSCPAHCCIAAVMPASQPATGHWPALLPACLCKP